jgi:4-pyridoxolactonase
VRVWLLDSGSLVLEHTHVMWNIPGPQVRIPVYSTLVEHDDGLVLFDTGLDRAHMSALMPLREPEQSAEQTIPAQLARCGFGVDDVSVVVNSHLHVDHVGGNHHFDGTGVRHVMHEREVAQSRAPEPFEVGGYSDRSWEYSGARIETFTGDLELAPGIHLLETPGHTVGHCSVLLTGAHPLLLAMDVAYTSEALEKGIQAGFHNNPHDGVRSITRVNEVAAEHGARIMYSHDPDAWREYRHAPDHYEV